MRQIELSSLFRLSGYISKDHLTSIRLYWGGHGKMQAILNRAAMITDDGFIVIVKSICVLLGTQSPNPRQWSPLS